MAVGAVLANERLNRLLKNDFGLCTKRFFPRGVRLGWLLLCKTLGTVTSATSPIANPTINTPTQRQKFVRRDFK